MTRADVIWWAKVALAVLAIIAAIALVAYMAGFFEGSHLNKMLGGGIWTSVIP